MIDGEELWEGSSLGVGFLSCENGVAQTEMLTRSECFEHGLVEELRGLVQAEPGRRERGDGAAALGGNELLGEGVVCQNSTGAKQSGVGRRFLRARALH